MTVTPSFTIPGNHDVVVVNGDRYTRDTTEAPAPANELARMELAAILEMIVTDVDAWIVKMNTGDDGLDPKDVQWETARALAEGGFILDREAVLRIVTAMSPKARQALFVHLPGGDLADYWQSIFIEMRDRRDRE